MLFIVFVAASFGSVGQAMCQTTTYSKSRSPSGFTKARVQMTDCGAVSGFSRVVWAQPAWLPDDRILSCRAVALDGQPAVHLDWTLDALIVTSDAVQGSVIAEAQSCYGWPVELRRGLSP